MGSTRFRSLLGFAVCTFVLAACAGGASQAPSPGQTRVTQSAAPAGSALPRIHLPVKKGETVEGLVQVDGHDIYARCSGTGSPTVVYFTGWAPDPSKYGVSAIQAIEAVDGGLPAESVPMSAATQGVARR
jgi:hypothetical protein